MDWRGVPNAFGNALGNSIVGAIKQSEAEKQRHFNLSVPGNETPFSLVDDGGISFADGSYPSGFFDSARQTPSESNFASESYEAAAPDMSNAGPAGQSGPYVAPLITLGGPSGAVAHLAEGDATIPYGNGPARIPDDVYQANLNKSPLEITVAGYGEEPSLLDRADAAISNFKNTVEDQLVYEGSLAKQNGDTLDFSGLKYTLIDTMLPGSIEAGAIGLLGGYAVGKGFGFAARYAPKLPGALGSFFGTGIDFSLSRGVSMMTRNAAYRVVNPFYFEFGSAQTNMGLPVGLRNPFEALEIPTFSVGNTRYSPFVVPLNLETRVGPMSIDTSLFSSGDITFNRGIRNSTKFWDAWSARYPEPLSPINMARIGDGRAPIVDDTWVEHFPEAAQNIGEGLVHHHLDYGPQAIPLPRSVHSLQPGWSVWHPAPSTIPQSLFATPFLTPTALFGSSSQGG